MWDISYKINLLSLKHIEVKINYVPEHGSVLVILGQYERQCSPTNI
jgi:hypothetical protein